MRLPGQQERLPARRARGLGPSLVSSLRSGLCTRSVRGSRPSCRMRIAPFSHIPIYVRRRELGFSLNVSEEVQVDRGTRRRNPDLRWYREGDRVIRSDPVVVPVPPCTTCHYRHNRPISLRVPPVPPIPPSERKQVEPSSISAGQAKGSGHRHAAITLAHVDRAGRVFQAPLTGVRERPSSSKPGDPSECAEQETHAR